MTAKPRLHFENREGETDFEIPRDFTENRGRGLSAMLRLKNEAQWIRPCLISIRGVFDEIVVALQNSTDDTERIVRDLGYDHVRIVHYPFDSFPNGPDHGERPADSVHAKAYFYNWTMAQTTREWVCKWDGDMVAMNWLGERVRPLMKRAEVIRIFGVDLVGDPPIQVGERVFNGIEPRFFRVRPSRFYAMGPRTEYLRLPLRDRVSRKLKLQPTIPDPAFLHFKWAKSLESATKAWPENWREMEVFQQLFKRAQPVDLYRGQYPSCLSDIAAVRDRALEEEADGGSVDPTAAVPGGSA